MRYCFRVVTQIGEKTLHSSYKRIYTDVNFMISSLGLPLRKETWTCLAWEVVAAIDLAHLVVQEIEGLVMEGLEDLEVQILDDKVGTVLAALVVSLIVAVLGPLMGQAQVDLEVAAVQDLMILDQVVPVVLGTIIQTDPADLWATTRGVQVILEK
ncbi:hypothetical protein SAY86_024411 [Trapa natans]|uniref:Uncharacterized protein n=1 Tax=Trapa natans TaxID=22666 RepID=A0AAN7M527_TRANT|nr:hypothetical protein SAY86_024411 [Trapa natans]